MLLILKSATCASGWALVICKCAPWNSFIAFACHFTNMQKLLQHISIFSSWWFSRRRRKYQLWRELGQADVIYVHLDHNSRRGGRVLRSCESLSCAWLLMADSHNCKPPTLLWGLGTPGVQLRTIHMKFTENQKWKLWNKQENSLHGKTLFPLSNLNFSALPPQCRLDARWRSRASFGHPGLILSWCPDFCPKT